MAKSSKGKQRINKNGLRIPRKPRPLLNTIPHVLEGVAFTPEKEIEKLRIRELEAIDAFAQGRANMGDWHSIHALLLLTHAMATAGVGPEALPACEAAKAALEDALDYHQQHGRPATTEGGLQAMRDLYEYQDLQRQSIARSEYEAFIRRCVQKVKASKQDVVLI